VKTTFFLGTPLHDGRLADSYSTFLRFYRKNGAQTLLKLAIKFVFQSSRTVISEKLSVKKIKIRFLIDSKSDN